jgi:hypothetical protein
MLLIFMLENGIDYTNLLSKKDSIAAGEKVVSNSRVESGQG